MNSQQPILVYVEDDENSILVMKMVVERVIGLPTLYVLQRRAFTHTTCLAAKSENVPVRFWKYYITALVNAVPQGCQEGELEPGIPQHQRVEQRWQWYPAHHE